MYQRWSWSKAEASWGWRTEELIKRPSSSLAEEVSRQGPSRSPGPSRFRAGTGPNTAWKSRISAGEEACLSGQRGATGPSCCLCTVVVVSDSPNSCRGFSFLPHPLISKVMGVSSGKDPTLPTLALQNKRSLPRLLYPGLLPPTSS